MQCPECKIENDSDASFCGECGKPLIAGSHQRIVGLKKSYLFIAVLVPVMLLVAGIGYYKFILPDGIAAVVNGEEITLSEVDAAAVPVSGPNGAPSGGLRHRILNQLIIERIVLQEARKVGMTVSEAELSSSFSEARASSGRDEAAFEQQVMSRYGDRGAYKHELKRRLLVQKFLVQKIIPPGADSAEAALAVDRWVQDVSGRASVRITLAEQGPGAGCGCCNKDSGPGTAQPERPACGQGKASLAGSPAREKTDEAQEAVLRFWRETHGSDPVTAKGVDSGCHVRVDVIKNNKIIGSLRYQNGSITEL